MQQTINDIFNWAESGLAYLGKVTGLGYMGVNYLLFIVIQPLLIALFFILWRKEVKNKKNEKDNIF